MIGQQAETLFEIKGVISCQIQPVYQVICSSPSDSSQIQTQIFDIEYYQWIHLAVSGSTSQSLTYLKLDYSDSNFHLVSQYYMKVTTPSPTTAAYLGIGSVSNLMFTGDIREFFYSQTFIPSDNVDLIRNQVMLANTNYQSYYRLNQGSLSDAQNGQNGTLIRTGGVQQPQAMWESLPNDMCEPFSTPLSLPLLTLLENGQSKQMRTAKLDSRMNYKSFNYEYSFSIWVKRFPGAPTKSDPYTGNVKNYFFWFQGVFTLWFTDPTNVGTYFYSNNNFQDSFSQPQFFPMGQWANYQIILSQQKGYEIRVTNMQGQILSVQKSSAYMAPTSPSGFFYFNNFIGYIRSMIMYQVNTGFPVKPSAIYTPIISSDVLFYYQFDQQYFVSNALQALSQYQTISGFVTTSPITFGDPLNFNTVLFEDLISANNSQYGTIQQPFSLFDGIACADKNYSLQSGTVFSYIQYPLPVFNNTITELTVELWFKQTKPQTLTTVFMTLNRQNSQTSYFSIQQGGTTTKDNVLRCVPFPFALYNQPLITLDIVDTIYTYTNWQHVACKFKMAQDFAAQYDNADQSQYFYSWDMFDQNFTIPKGSYSLIINNNAQSKSGSFKAFYKEARVWTRYLPTSEILKNLYHKVDPSFDSTLLSYFQMASGSIGIQDYMYSGMSQPFNSSGMLSTVDSSLLICPQYSYQNQFTQNGCSKQPFSSPQILIIAEPTSDSPYLQYRFTSQYSMFNNDQVKSNSMNYNWVIQDSGVQSNYFSSQMSKSEVVLPRTALNNNQKYTIGLTTTNAMYTYQNYQALTFVPAGCRYLGDQNTQQQINDKIYYHSQGDEDINIAFKVYSVQSTNCATATNFNTLHYSFDTQYFPQTYTPAGIQLNYNTNSQTFTIYIAAFQLKTIPFEKYFTIVCTVYWNDVSGNLASLNIVYRIMFAYPSTSVITTNQVNILVNQWAALNGNGSSVPALANALQNKAGLSYQWSCAFQACAQNSSSKSIFIFYEDFLNSGGVFDKAYQIQLGVWRANNYDNHAQSLSNVQITWRNVQVPNFTIVVSGKMTLASSDTIFYIQFYNYASDDSNLRIFWTFTPSIANPDTNMQYSQDSSVLKILAGGMSFNTSYMVQAKAYNNLYPAESQSSQTLNFTTGVPPSNGTVSASPTTGTFLSTQFYFSVKDWTTKYPPVSFRLYGIQAPSSPPIKLTQQWYTQGQIFNTTLPSLTSVIFEITDAKQESVEVTSPLVVFLTSSTDFNSLVSTYSSNTNTDQKYSYLNYIAQEMNYQRTQDSSIQTVQASQAIMNVIATDLSSIKSYNESQSAQSLIMSACSVLPILLSNSNNLNSQIANQAFQALTIMSSASTIFQNALTDSDFQQNYANALSYLLNYSNNQGSRRRRLDGQTIDPLTIQLLTQIQNLTDQLCSTMSQYQTKKSTATPLFEIFIEKFPVNTTVVTSTYQSANYSHQIVAPVIDIVTASKTSQNSSLTDVCVQASFFYSNLFKGMNFPNQTQNLMVTLKLGSVDNFGYHIVDYGKINSLQSPFNQQFAYNYNDQSLNFSTNFTHCMYINTTLVEGTYADRWSMQQCSTTYLYASKAISCACNGVGPYFYGIINDNTTVPLNVSNTTNVSADNSTVVKPVIVTSNSKFNLEILVVIGIIAALNLILPLVAILNDKKDYEAIKNDEFEIKDDLLMKIALRKKVPIEQLLYRKRLIQEFQDLTDVKCCKLFSLFFRQLHPLFNIAFKFDVEFKRLLRFMIVLYQICIIAIIATLVFGTNYRKNEKQRSDMDSKDLTLALIVGAVCTILTLPLPNVVITCIRTRLVMESEIIQNIQHKTPSKIKGKNDPESAHVPSTQQRLSSQEDEINRKKGKKAKTTERLKEFDAAQVEDPIAAVDNCIPLKIMLIMLSQALFVGTLIFLGLTAYNVCRAQVLCIVLSWGLAVGGGWFIINIVRIGLIAVIAPKVLINSQANQGQPRGCGRCLDCLIIPHEALDLLSDMFIVYQTQLGPEQQIPDQEQPDQVNADQIEIQVPDRKPKGISKVEKEEEQEKQDDQMRPSQSPQIEDDGQRSRGTSQASRVFKRAGRDRKARYSENPQ